MTHLTEFPKEHFMKKQTLAITLCIFLSSYAMEDITDEKTTYNYDDCEKIAKIDGFTYHYSNFTHPNRDIIVESGNYALFDTCNFRSLTIENGARAVLLNTTVKKISGKYKIKPMIFKLNMN